MCFYTKYLDNMKRLFVIKWNSLKVLWFIQISKHLVVNVISGRWTGKASSNSGRYDCLERPVDGEALHPFILNKCKVKHVRYSNFKFQANMFTQNVQQTCNAGVCLNSPNGYPALTYAGVTSMLMVRILFHSWSKAFIAERLYEFIISYWFGTGQCVQFPVMEMHLQIQQAPNMHCSSIDNQYFESNRTK